MRTGSDERFKNGSRGNKLCSVYTLQAGDVRKFEVPFLDVFIIGIAVHGHCRTIWIVNITETNRMTQFMGGDVLEIHAVRIVG